MLMDKILKLIVEDISVTRADQISSRLKLDYNTVLSLLKEMENSGHIKLMTAGGEEVYVIILKSPGRQFYKSSKSYAELTNEPAEDKSFKISRKTLTWAIIGIAILVVIIIGYKQGWFS